jgi:hypothetical protein
MQGLPAVKRAYWSSPARGPTSQGAAVNVHIADAGFALKSFFGSAVRDPAKWLLIFLPIMLAAANSGWLFTGPGWIDAWVYFGYFQHLTIYKSILFPNLYYGSRLPWILPGYVAYHLFEPRIANFVLHFAFYYAAIFSFYSLMKRAVGSRNALLATVLFGSYAPFLSAIGWDYVDGAGVTYFLLALAAAARATETRPRFWLLVAGMAGMAMCYTNMFLFMFVPFVAGIFLFRRLSGLNLSSLWAVVDLCVWFGAGAVLVTVALGAINHFLDGNFWFYSPSIGFYLAMRAQRNPWVVQGWSWLREAYWLGIPAAAAVASVVFAICEMVRRRLKFGDFRTFFVLQFLAVACGMIAWQSIGATGLYLTWYASYIIPSVFLAIGCILAGSEEERATKAWWAVLLCTVGLFLVSLRMANGDSVQVLRRLTGFPVVTALAAAGLLGNVVFQRKWYAVVAAVAGLGYYQIGYSGLDRPSDQYQVEWRHVVDGADAIWPYEQKHPVSFWYNKIEPHGSDFYSINSVYLWGYSYVGTDFPKIEVPSRLVSGATIAMPIESPDWLERANRVLRENHFQGSLMGIRTIGHDAHSFQIGFLKIEALPPS